MKKLKQNWLKIMGLLFAAVLFLPGFANANILFYEDFEDKLDSSSWHREHTNEGSRELSTEQKRAGLKSRKFTLTRNTK